MAFTAKDVQALRQATGAGMMDAKKALEENDGDFETPPSSGCASRAWPSRPSATDRENTQGAVAVVRRRQRRRHRRARSARPTSSPSREHFSQPRPTSWPTLVAAKGEDAVAEQQADASTTSRSRSRRTSSSVDVVRFEARRRQRARHLPPRAGRPRRQRRARRAGRRHARSWPTTSPCTSPSPSPTYLRRDEVPGRRGRGRARDARAHHPQRGQARAGAARRSSRAGSTAGSRSACLLEQPYAKDDKQTITQLLGGAKIVRFAQVEIG